MSTHTSPISCTYEVDLALTKSRLFVNAYVKKFSVGLAHTRSNDTCSMIPQSNHMITCSYSTCTTRNVALTVGHVCYGLPQREGLFD